MSSSKASKSAPSVWEVQETKTPEELAVESLKQAKTQEKEALTLLKRASTVELNSHAISMVRKLDGTLRVVLMKYNLDTEEMKIIINVDFGVDKLSAEDEFKKLAAQYALDV